MELTHGIRPCSRRRRVCWKNGSTLIHIVRRLRLEVPSRKPSEDHQHVLIRWQDQNTNETYHRTTLIVSLSAFIDVCG